MSISCSKDEKKKKRLLKLRICTTHFLQEPQFLFCRYIPDFRFITCSENMSDILCFSDGQI